MTIQWRLQSVLRKSVLLSMGFSSVMILGWSARAAEFAIPRDLVEAAKKIEALASDSKLTAKSCKDELMAMNDALYNLEVVSKDASGKFVSYFTNESGLTAAEAARGQDVINVIFRARTKFNARMQDMIRKEAFSNRNELEECTKAMKVTQRTLRGMEDYWGLMALKKANQLGDEQIKLVQDSALQKSEWPALLINSDVVKAKSFTASDVQSGDVLLSLGSAFTASVIGRINSVDSQFSHMAIAYVDDGSVFGAENKGRGYVIEAEPDSGVRIVRIEDYLKHGNVRVAVYRFTNLKNGSTASKASDVAARAAKYIVKKAKEAIDQGKPICYNFAMDMNDEKCLFCSQEIAVAYNAACKESGVKCEEFPGLQQLKDPFPFMMSKFDRAGNSLVRMLAIEVDETYAPGDAEMDPRFTLVAEWRNHGALRKPRYYNMTLSKMMQWMEDGGYEIADIANVKALAAVGEKAVKQMGKMPEGMPRGFVEGSVLMAFLMMHTGPGDAIASKIPAMGVDQSKSLMQSLGVPQDVVESSSARMREILQRLVTHVGFTTRLSNLDDANLKATGYFLTDSQMDKALDRVMIKDCEKTQKGESVMYHDILRPASGKACMKDLKPLKGIW